MNIKNFFTKKNSIIIGSVFMVTIIVTVVLVLIIVNISKKPSKDLIAAVDETWLSAKAEEQPAYLSKLDKLSSFKLNSVKRENNTYVISATVTAPDLGSQLSELDPSELPQNEKTEDINTFLCEQIEKSKIKKTTSFIYAYKINGEYHITFSDEFADAMSGNLYEYSQKAYLDILQKYKEGELK